MPLPPDDTQIRFVGAHAAAMALERAANAVVPLHTVAHDWFPDHDAIDQREIAKRLSRELEDIRRLVLQRLDKMIEKGKAVRPGGSVDSDPGQALPAR